MVFNIIIPSIVFIALLIDSIIDIKFHKKTARPKIFAYFITGMLLVVSYGIYAVIFANLSFVDVVLLATTPDEVKNIWGQKNLFYAPPLGYSFIAVSVVLCAVKPWFKA